MKIVDIATEINSEIDDSNISIPAIAYWLRTNLGWFNSLTNNSFEIESITLEINPSISEEEKAIFKDLYLLHYYQMKIRENLGAASVDVGLEVSSDGATIRTVNKNEISKTYLNLRKECAQEMKELLQAYNSNNLTPHHIAGDDYISATDYYYNV